MVLRDSLKAGVISQIYLAEGVNGSVEAKVLGQWVGSGCIGGLWVGRVRIGWSGGGVEW